MSNYPVSEKRICSLSNPKLVAVHRACYTDVVRKKLLGQNTKPQEFTLQAITKEMARRHLSIPIHKD